MFSCVGQGNELLLLLSNPFGPYRREGRVVRSCPLSVCVGSNSCNDRQGCGWLYIGTRGGTCTRMLWCTCVVSSCTSAGLFNHTHMILTLFLCEIIYRRKDPFQCMYIYSSFIIDDIFFWPCIYNQSSVQIVTLLID